MSRMQILVSRPKRTLAALATLLVAVGITAASGANFNASSANPSNTFSSGTLSILNDKEGAVVLSASNLRPGDTPSTGEVVIQNTGSLSGVFALAKTGAGGSAALPPKLNLRVVDCAAVTPACGELGETVVYNGTVADMGTVTPIAPLGTFLAAEQHRYQFSVQLDGSATIALQGLTSTVDFGWTATS